MSQPGRDHGSLAHLNSGTGLAELLSAFATHGGQVTGARRWPENPLALTNVRWQGPAGQLLDATRHPGDEAWLLQGEREAWVQMALHYPATAQPTPSGPAAPWLPLDLDRMQAQALLSTLAQARAAGAATPGWGSNAYGTPAPRSGFHQRYSPAESAFGGQPNPFSGPPRDDYRPPMRSPEPAPGGYWSAGPQSYSSGRVSGSGMPDDDSGGQITGGWHAPQAPAAEMVIIPCVEVELPPSSGAAGSQDFVRDYAKDVAVHFARAAHTIPQVRELRAWMRGDRLVLAARMVLGPGSRPLTRAEMDGAMALLADVLQQRTLPYSRIGLADQGEWQAGSQMPE